MNILQRLFGKTNTESPTATVPRELHSPDSIVCFDGGIVINGPVKPDWGDFDSITVGVTEVPSRDENIGMEERPALVTDFDESLDSRDLTPENLLFALGEMLGYTITKK